MGNVVVAVEYSKINPGCFREWTNKDVKEAFNFGNGKIENLKRYYENNKEFIKMIFLNSGGSKKI